MPCSHYINYLCVIWREIDLLSELFFLAVKQARAILNKWNLAIFVSIIGQARIDEILCSISKIYISLPSHPLMRQYLFRDTNKMRKCSNGNKIREISSQFHSCLSIYLSLASQASPISYRFVWLSCFAL